MTARAIPRNATRVIDPLRQRLVFCVLVSADNNYRSQVCHPRHAWWALDHHAKATLRPCRMPRSDSGRECGSAGSPPDGCAEPAPRVQIRCISGVNQV